MEFANDFQSSSLTVVMAGFDADVGFDADAVVVAVNDLVSRCLTTIGCGDAKYVLLPW